MGELLPCPFCGAEAVTRFESMEQVWSIRCTQCEAAKLYAAYSDEEAIAAWNTRSPVSDGGGK